MKVYGLKIGDVGLEYSSRDDREKSIITLTRGSVVGIRDYGIRYKDQAANFSTYEREATEVVANCTKCNGIFQLECCPTREYLYKEYSGKWVATNGFICDGCFAKQLEAKKVADLPEQPVS